MTCLSSPFRGRSQPGHHRPQRLTEGDLIIGKEGLSAIGTLIERHSRIVRLLRLPRRDGATVRRALTERLKDLLPGLLRSITWDQGTEMARHGEVTAALGVPVYFCNSRSPWQRGSKGARKRSLSPPG